MKNDTENERDNHDDSVHYKFNILQFQAVISTHNINGYKNTIYTQKPNVRTKKLKRPRAHDANARALERASQPVRFRDRTTPTTHDGNHVRQAFPAPLLQEGDAHSHGAFTRAQTTNLASDLTRAFANE